MWQNYGFGKRPLECLARHLTLTTSPIFDWKDNFIKMLKTHNFYYATFSIVEGFTPTTYKVTLYQIKITPLILGYLSCGKVFK
jgi:hypothetical protein